MFSKIAYNYYLVTMGGRVSDNDDKGITVLCTILRIVSVAVLQLANGSFQVI